MSWNCATCGKFHDDLPLSFAADFPDNYANLSAEERDNRALISSDQCIIDEREFYIRGCLEIPIQGSSDIFLWGLWANLFPEDFDVIDESWQEEGRENTRGPFKGRLANAIREYPFETANLKLTVKLRPAGERPMFLIDEPGHPLAIAQRDGMTSIEVQKLVESLLHRAPKSVN